MNKFMYFIEEIFMPPMTKLAQMTYLKAIRSGMVVIIPLVIVGSFFLIIINFPVPAVQEFFAPYAGTLVIPFRLTVFMMSIYATFGIGSALGRERGLDEVNSGILALVAFMMTIIPLNGQVMQMVVNPDTKTPEMTETILGPNGWYLPFQYIGSAGLFGAIIVSIFAVEVFYFMKKKNFTIKMPEQVPPSVSNSFAALYPTAVVVFILFIIVDVLRFDIHGFINKLLSPLSGFLAGENLFGAVITVVFITMLWAAGIHGVSIIGGLLRPFWQSSLEVNTAHIADNLPVNEIPNIIVEPFYQWFVWIGGSGGTVGLIIAALLIAKSSTIKEITKISAVPMIFNINEPIIFGFPIVMNPALIIPFILGPTIVTIVSFVAMKMNLVTVPYILASWTLPGPLGAIFATTDWRAGILCIVNIIILTIVYLPFVKIYDKQMLKEEGALDA
ncbi:MAG: PTS sugar transporter subunit IIC [Mycoplasmatales bacterium]